MGGLMLFVSINIRL